MGRAGATPIKRIALIEPLGDPGIGTYTYELAKGLAAAGVEADVYTAPDAWTLSLPRIGALYPVLGSALLRQRRGLAAPTPGSPGGGIPDMVTRPTAAPGFLKRMLRQTYLSFELAAWLKSRRYDFAWTQWPDMGPGRVTFWGAARALGLPVIHTAHNVLPHEGGAGDHEQCERVYQRSRAVVVHSEAARRDLLREYPALRQKVIVSPLGLYTAYPRRPEARAGVRRELNIPPGSRAVLFFGGVRPYKNVDAVLEALRADRSGRFVSIVAGFEFGYPDSVPGDALGRTRRLAKALGVEDRVRLVPGPFDYARTSELFEASDIVAMPYLESYGSGQLLLAMSFGKYVVATRTGGMDEHLSQYPAHALLESGGGADVLSALRQVDGMMGEGEGALSPRPPELEWGNIVGALLPQVSRYV